MRKRDFGKKPATWAVFGVVLALALAGCDNPAGNGGGIGGGDPAGGGGGEGTAGSGGGGGGTEGLHFAPDGAGFIVIGFTGTTNVVVIPASFNGLPVVSIGGGAFGGHQLISVSIPDSVTYIRMGAFAENRLTTVTIPDSVTYIGRAAFINNQLTIVSVPAAAFVDYQAFDLGVTIIRRNGPGIDPGPTPSPGIPRTLVIANVPTAQFNTMLNSFADVRVFPTGTTRWQAESNTGLIARRTAGSSELGHRLIMPLLDTDNNFWTGSGTFDIFFITYRFIATPPFGLEVNEVFVFRSVTINPPDAITNIQFGSSTRL